MLRLHNTGGDYIKGDDLLPGADCMDCGEHPGAEHQRSNWCPRALADALLPTVDRLCAEAAAEALREAAEWLDNGAPDETSNGISWEKNVGDEDTALAWATSSLRDRAAALTETKEADRG